MFEDKWINIIQGKINKLTHLMYFTYRVLFYQNFCQLFFCGQLLPCYLYWCHILTNGSRIGRDLNRTIPSCIRHFSFCSLWFSYCHRWVLLGKPFWDYSKDGHRSIYVVLKKFIVNGKLFLPFHFCNVVEISRQVLPLPIIILIFYLSRFS